MQGSIPQAEMFPALLYFPLPDSILTIKKITNRVRKFPSVSEKGHQSRALCVMGAACLASPPGAKFTLAHGAQKSTEREQGKMWRPNCHSTQRKKDSEIVKANALLWSSLSNFFLPQQNCSGNSRHDKRWHGASQGETARRALCVSPVIKILPAALSVAVESNHCCQANKKKRFTVVNQVNKHAWETVWQQITPREKMRIGTIFSASSLIIIVLEEQLAWTI